MDKREIEIKKIIHAFAIWEAKIANNNYLSLYDANIFSEYSICELLNSIYGYKLQNLNTVQKNFPAIDLGDKINRVSFQITSTKSSKKIQNTIDSFVSNNLGEAYDELFVLILGKKQNKYPKFKVPAGLNFDENKNIIDFRSLLSDINVFPVSRLEGIARMIAEEHHVGIRQSAKQSDAIKVRKRLALKQRMKKDLLVDLDRKDWEKARYEPWIRFRCGNLIIRSVKDESFPNVDEDPAHEMSWWFKTEPWNFYEKGIEIISQGGSAIFDKDGNWDIVDWRNNDEREHNPDYKVVKYLTFARIPYDFIVSYDKEADEYYGYPTVWVEYAKNGMPYDEILYGCVGSHELKQYTRMFDNERKKKLP